MFSQELGKDDNSWAVFVQEIAESTDNEQNINSLYERLSDIHEHPFNINQISKEQLEQLPFLSDAQIENILAYLYVSGPMKSIYELNLVKDLDLETIKRLLPFVYLGQPEKRIEVIDWKRLFQKGNSRVYLRFDSNLNRKAGYQLAHDSTDINRYLGSPPYSFVKYDFNAGSKLQMGFLVEKDAGERIRDGFYSFHVLLKDIGWIRRLALGYYKLSFGQGLVMNTNFALSKSIIATNIGARAEGVSRHYSTDEINYLQGAAMSYELGRNQITAFASIKKAAATLNDSVLTSLKSDSYFNTENDLKQRNAFIMSLLGANWQRRFGCLTVGATALHYFFDKPVIPESRRDNFFDFRGKENSNFSFDYQCRVGRLSFLGETAISGNGSLATLNGVQIRASSKFSASILQRSYSKSYHAYYGASFAESSRTQNEQGVYWGAEWHPGNKWFLKGYADLFRFPWLKYGVSQPSSGFDGMLQVGYSIGDNLLMNLRYRYKEKEKDIPGEAILYQTERYATQRLHWQCEYSADKTLKLQTTIDCNRYKEEFGVSGGGFAISQSISKKWGRLPLTSDVQLMIFDTDGYETAVYAYEKSVLYAFSFPSFYGKGYRWMANLRYELSSQLSCWMKFAQTVYRDREVIGSGLEAISGNGKNDIYLLLRWKF
jgi:DNA uptake protein and related DNA-binding proteins